MVVLTELIHRRYEESPERGELRTLCDNVGIVELLAGIASQGQVHPQRLCGFFTLIKEWSAAEPLQSICSKALVKRASAALTKPVGPLDMIITVKLWREPQRTHGDRAPPKANVGGVTQPEMSGHVDPDGPVTLGALWILKFFHFTRRGWFLPNSPSAVAQEWVRVVCYTTRVQDPAVWDRFPCQSPVLVATQPRGVDRYGLLLPPVGPDSKAS